MGNVQCTGFWEREIISLKLCPGLRWETCSVPPAESPPSPRSRSTDTWPDPSVPNSLPATCVARSSGRKLSSLITIMWSTSDSEPYDCQSNTYLFLSTILSIWNNALKLLFNLLTMKYFFCEPMNCLINLQTPSKAGVAKMRSGEVSCP